jgi:hypothetical protein
MKYLKRFIALPLLFLFICSYQPMQAQSKPLKDVNVSITKIGNVWKAVLTGTDSTEVRVQSGQKITFHAEGTEVIFQFDNDTLFGGHSKIIKKDKSKTFGVGQVKKGVYIYSAFCVGPKVFAQGGSPPKIIVD